MKALLLTMCVAGFFSASGAAAGDAKLTEVIGRSVDAFSAVCLPNLPAFPKDGKDFSAFGYATAFKDPGMFSRAGGGFAGIGYAAVEGGPRTAHEPNGCLVYFPGLAAEAAVPLFDKAMSRKFKLIEKQTIGSDYYWTIRDFAPRRFIAFVAPKAEGTYAGHTLLMITEQKLSDDEKQKRVTQDPKFEKEASRRLEELKKLPPEDRIAYFASSQFAQCLLATDFTTIEFDNEIGVKRAPSNTAGENHFIDSTTGNVMMTSAQSCLVAFQGTNMALALEGIKPLLKLRDKDSIIQSYERGYAAKLNLDGKPHILQIASSKLEGRDYVRMLLAAQPAN